MLVEQTSGRKSKNKQKKLTLQGKTATKPMNNISPTCPGLSDSMGR